MMSVPLDKQVKTVRDSLVSGSLECLVEQNDRRNCYREGSIWRRCVICFSNGHKREQAHSASPREAAESRDQQRG